MTDALVRLIVVLPAFDWIVAAILGIVAYRFPYILTLRERFVTAVMLAIVATIAAVLGTARLGLFELDNERAITLLAFALVLASVPAMVWLLLLVAGRFRLPGGDE